MHKEIVQAQVKVAPDKYELVECEVNMMDNGDSVTMTSVQASRYNVGITLEAQRKLRDARLKALGLKVSTAKGKEITKGESLDIDMD